jgi:metallo-beta-lactamase family protein
MHILNLDGHKVLLDCGRSRQAQPSAPLFPFDPAEVSALILSHAHVDHCGNLPALVRRGFRGPIFCTPPTFDLLDPVLADSARHQEGDAWIHRIVTGQREDDHILFRYSDVMEVLRLGRAVPYGETFEVLPGVTGSFADAGHILGSAMLRLQIDTPRCRGSLAFTGDLGRAGLPILRSPERIPDADLLICEATYGGRRHETIDLSIERLAEIVRRTAERGGKVLIPSFSLGRMQLVIHALQQLMRKGALPRLPLFVDSPLAIQFREIYRRHPECFNEPMQRELQKDPDFLTGEDVTYLRTREESMAAAEERGPSVIVASGGMCDGGRVVHHLKQHLDDPRCTVVLISYQAPGTLGRQLLEPRSHVRFHGRRWNFWAEVAELNGFSGHADHEELLTALRPVANRIGKLCLVHGEYEAARHLLQPLRDAGFGKVHIPAQGEVVEIG